MHCRDGYQSGKFGPWAPSRRMRLWLGFPLKQVEPFCSGKCQSGGFLCGVSWELSRKVFLMRCFNYFWDNDTFSLRATDVWNFICGICWQLYRYFLSGAILLLRQKEISWKITHVGGFFVEKAESFLEKYFWCVALIAFNIAFEIMTVFYCELQMFGALYVEYANNCRRKLRSSGAVIAFKIDVRLE